MIHFLIATLLVTAWGQVPAQEIVWDTHAKAWISVDTLADQIARGDIVVLGEQHATEDNQNERAVQIHHANQTRLIHLSPVPIALGMEFFSYTTQIGIDAYVRGAISEPEFLSLQGWSSNAFPLYRAQIFASARTVGLNIPRRLSAKVARYGPNSLTSVEASWLPPIWELGAKKYYDRFSEAMRGHVPEEKIERYFWAQSLWDDTMAWTATSYIKAHYQHAMLILVGEFHAEFKDGLPARLKRHGARKVKVIVQQEVGSWDSKEIAKLTRPDAKYGARADYIWFWTATAKAESRSAGSSRR